MSIQFPDGITPARFMRDFWQRKPLLLRGALSPALFPLSADELAGLACEDELESRLIVGGNGAEWSVRHGPFAVEDFERLPESHWTLLVQDVDKFVPPVARLIDEFDFVPQWRIDDIMISFASDGGGVGPHTDAYDVFLMQGAGRRRWRISLRDYSEDDLLPGLEQRILAHLEVDHDWLLEPGDILYLPPGVAHWGTADGPCMTYSLGFRSPNQQELAADWFQHLVALTDAGQRLADPADRELQRRRAELTPGLVDNAAGLFSRLPSAGSEDFRLWLGCHLTEPKPQFQILPPDDPWHPADLTDWLVAGRGFVRHPAARLCWSRLDAARLALFANGDSMVLPDSLLGLVDLLGRQRRLVAGDLAEPLQDPASRALFLQLLNQGIIEGEEDAG
jgi:50S ribosomal protein L16 3-hydroxylase